MPRTKKQEQDNEIKKGLYAERPKTLTQEQQRAWTLGKINNNVPLDKFDMDIIEHWYTAQTLKPIYDDSFIRIPKAVVNMDISIQAKYLYGFLYGFQKVGGSKATNSYICNFLNCNIKSLTKYLNELKKNNCIKIEIADNNKRVIYPLVQEGIQIISDKELIEYYAQTYEFEPQREHNQQILKSLMAKIK